MVWVFARKVEDVQGVGFWGLGPIRVQGSQIL